MKLLTTDGLELQSFKPMGGPDETSISFVVPTADLAPGDYVIRLDALNPGNGKTESKQLTIHRVTALPAWKSYIDSHRRLIVDGKPFFPLGMYFGGISDSAGNLSQQPVQLPYAVSSAQARNSGQNRLPASRYSTA